MAWLGCFLSSSKGYDWMGKTAVLIGADTFQFFTRNPRGGKAKDLDVQDVGMLRAMQENGTLGPVIAHAPYTVNPCSSAERTREFAAETMAEDLRRLEYLPGNFYNFHPGSHVGQGREAGIYQIADCLNQVLFPDMQTVVLLETMAGKGTEIGCRFEELREIIDRVERNQYLGVCLDTCHIYDAGYDIVNNLDGVLTEFDRVIGLDRLKAVHLNDSKNPLGSRKDRHEKLGQGCIGMDAILRIIMHPAFAGLPMSLETPNELEGYEKELEFLRRKLREEVL